MPRVSVLMSVYNGECYLRESVVSILTQTFTDFEFIIMDDGSTDTTWSILSSYSDPRIKLVRNEKNIGLSRSLNKGLALACGEYIARMDADDISLPERLSTQVTFLDMHPDVGLVGGNFEIMDEKGETIKYRERDCHPDLVKWYQLFYNHISGHGGVMFRVSLVRELGGYSEKIISSQDYDLWSRIAQRAHIVILPEVLFRWRQHESSVSSVHFEDQLQNAYLIAYQNLENLMGIGWAREEAYLEMIGFWLGRFSMCQKPIRLWYNLARVQFAFVKQRELMSSEREFRDLLKKAKCKQILHLANYWLEQRHYIRVIISRILVVMNSPSEGMRILNRKLERKATGSVSEAA